MARSGLNIGLRDLAKRADVMTSAIRRLEAGGVVPERTLAAIRNALEAAGVDFIFENGNGPGVRLRAPTILAIKANRGG